MNDKKASQREPAGIGRRKFLNTAALAGLTAGVAACNDKPAASTAPSTTAPAAAPAAHAASEVGKYEVAPGQLDEYYSFSSGGHSGATAGQRFAGSEASQALS